MPSSARAPSSHVRTVTDRRALWEWPAQVEAPLWFPGRVLTGNAFPLPIGMMHPCFTVFEVAMDADTSSDATAAANSLVDTMDAFFAGTDKEVGLNDKIIKALARLFPSMTRMSLSGYSTDGTVLAGVVKLPVLNQEIKIDGGEGSAQNERYLFECIMRSPDAKVDESGRLSLHPDLQTRFPALPCFLWNIQPGSVLEVRGAVVAGAAMISQPLAVASLRGIRGSKAARMLARVLHATKAGVDHLAAAYAALDLDGRDPVPVPSPSLTALLQPIVLGDGTRVRLLRELTPGAMRLTFVAAVVPPGAGAGGGGGAAPAAGPVEYIIITLARGGYGTAVHERAAALGLAPELRPGRGGVTGLPDDIVAVACMPLDGAWQAFDAATATDAMKVAVRAAYHRALGVEYVHGDLRYGAVLIREAAEAAPGFEVKFLSFDSAGPAGEARYPAHFKKEAWRAAGLLDAFSGGVIQQVHDLHWLPMPVPPAVVAAAANGAE